MSKKEVFSPNASWEKSILISEEAIRQGRGKLEFATRRGIEEFSKFIPYYYFKRYPIIVVLLDRHPKSDPFCVLVKYIPPEEECSALSNLNQYFANWDTILWENKPARRLGDAFRELRSCSFSPLRDYTPITESLLNFT